MPATTKLAVDAERGAQAAERRASASVDRIRRTRAGQWQRERRVGACQWTEASKWLDGIGGRWASTEREKAHDQRGRRTDGAETAPFRYGHKCLPLAVGSDESKHPQKALRREKAPLGSTAPPSPQCSPSSPLGRAMRLPSGQRQIYVCRRNLSSDHIRTVSDKSPELVTEEYEIRCLIFPRTEYAVRVVCVRAKSWQPGGFQCVVSARFTPPSCAVRPRSRGCRGATVPPPQRLRRAPGGTCARNETAATRRHRCGVRADRELSRVRC